MQVKNFMTRNPACCTSDSTLEEVAHMMEMYDCGCVPVVENHQTKRPIGTITDRDITIRTLGANKNPMEMKASDIMTTDIVTVTPETSIDDCMDVMEDKQIRRVLVVDKTGKCIGIVAQADLAEHGNQPGQLAKFVREVSENDSDDNGSRDRANELHHSSNRAFELNRSQNSERQSLRSNRNFYSEEQQDTRSQKKTFKSRPKKESFFSSNMFLTLLGSIGIGAVAKYYFDLDSENKRRRLVLIENHNVGTNAATERKTSASSIDSTTTSFPIPATVTEGTDTLGVTTTSFNKINDDDDLKPILEVGRSTSGS